jgi:hypothetical protein
MSVDRRLLNWGVFLVLLGAVPLAVAQGWVPRDLVARAWELWPLLLVGAGIGLILGATPFRALGGIVVSATFGVMLGALVAVGFGGFNVGGFACGGGGADAPQILQESGSFDGGTGSLILAGNCASLEVATGAGSAWSIDVHGTDNARPTVERTNDKIAVRSPNSTVVFPFGNQRASWRAELGTGTRFESLTMELNAGDASVNLAGATVSQLTFNGNAIGNTRLDLSGATVERLDVAVNAADVAILLPAQADLRGEVEGNAASVDLCAQAGIGLRLIVDDNITASDNYDGAGLVRSGSAWETPGYASAATRIELRTIGSAVSYTLNPEDGCR